MTRYMFFIYFSFWCSLSSQVLEIDNGTNHTRHTPRIWIDMMLDTYALVHDTRTF
jgi:hypothetical protein